MIITGRYNTATIMGGAPADAGAIEQIRAYLDTPLSAGQTIRIMPDYHGGAGCVIGFTATMGKYVIPNQIGVDIGCGVLACNVGQVEVAFGDFDRYVREHIPAGFSVHSEPPDGIPTLMLPLLKTACAEIGADYNRTLCSIGTLGGGNHFIEADRDDSGNLWLVVHSGSRNFGLKVANYFANRYNKGFGRGLEAVLVADGVDYLNHMTLAQHYATVNRRTIMVELCEYFDKHPLYCDTIQSVHNYISDGMIRKGAISAEQHERVVIPLNMRDGVIFGTGKGNPEWNYSAPHGAGRVLSRRQAKEVLNVADFQKEMKGIYTTSICYGTLDESPLAYKSPAMIQEAIADTVSIDFVAKPVYSFKAGDTK